MVGIVIALWEIFQCRNTTEKYLIGICVLFSPSVADLLTYYYCADSEIKILIRKIIRMVSGIGLSAAGYLLLFKILEKVGYLYPTNTRGMDNIVGNLFEKSAGLIQIAYKVFWDYFFTGRLINNYWRGRRYLNVLILVGTVMLIAYLFWKKQVYKSLVKSLLLIVVVVTFPIMLTLIVIVTPDAVDDNISSITKGMISQYSLLFGTTENVSNGWITLLQYYCGVNYTPCDAEQRERIVNSAEMEDMGLFPCSTSVKKIEDVIVIRFS